MTSGDNKEKKRSPARGLARGLTNYGDSAFSLYLRRSFAKSMGYSSDLLGRPVVGIADSRSGFNNCHRHLPQLIDVEEMIRAQPMDAVVLVGGCDKTVPAQLMGAVSADLPAVQLIAGPMMPTSFRGERLGACTHCRRFLAMHRAGKVDAQGIEGVEGNLATPAGTC